MYKRKYKKGYHFTSIGGLAIWLEDGGNIYIDKKFMNNKWVCQMPFQYLCDMIKVGVLCRAVENDE